MIKTIIVFGGKTMGHVIPGLSVAKGIKNKNPFTKIIYITSDKQKDLKMVKINEIDKLYFINYTNSKSLKDIMHIYVFIKNIYMKYHPNLIISFGSVLGTIGLLLARIYNIPSILHEQNKVMGLGNKLSLYLTKNVFLNYKMESMSLKKKNLKVVGLPTLLDFEQNTLKKNKKKIVFLSGSNGANFINDIGIEFSKNEFSKKYEITIISGTKYYEKVKDYIKTIKHVKVVPFIENLYLFLKDANIVITRGGATTLQELKHLGIKCIIIPSPNVSGNHQYYNALEHLNHSKVLIEKNYTISHLINSIQELENNNTIKIDNINCTTNFIEALNEVYNIY